MITMDAPSREICSIRRITTNTPLQALITLNDTVYIEAAQALARRMARDVEGADLNKRLEYGMQLYPPRKMRLKFGYSKAVSGCVKP